MVAKANAEAAYKATPKAREDARVARAEATHNVAKEKCDDLSGNAKDVCVKEADAALVKAKADAKVDRVAADTQQDSTMKQADARQKAVEEKRDADYKVAVEKCDALSGSAKNTCVSNAKVQYGKSQITRRSRRLAGGSVICGGVVSLPGRCFVRVACGVCVLVRRLLRGPGRRCLIGAGTEASPLPRARAAGRLQCSSKAAPMAPPAHALAACRAAAHRRGGRRHAVGQLRASAGTP
jgi:chemotaxis protein histidine kinase CheA